MHVGGADHRHHGADHLMGLKSSVAGAHWAALLWSPFRNGVPKERNGEGRSFNSKGHSNIGRRAKGKVYNRKQQAGLCHFLTYTYVPPRYSTTSHPPLSSLRPSIHDTLPSSPRSVSRPLSCTPSRLSALVCTSNALSPKPC